MIYQNNNGIVTQTQNIYENNTSNIKQINSKYENVEGVARQVYDANSLLVLYDNGVLSDVLGTLGANRVVTDGIQGSYSQQASYIEINSYRNYGETGGKQYTIDFQNKMTAQVYKAIHIKYDIIINSPNPQYGGGAYLDVLRSANNFIKQTCQRYNENGTFTDEELTLDISDVTEDFYIVINSYCFSNANQYSTTLRVKKIWLTA